MVSEGEKVSDISFNFRTTTVCVSEVVGFLVLLLYRLLSSRKQTFSRHMVIAEAVNMHASSLISGRKDWLVNSVAVVNDTYREVSIT